MPRNNRYQRRGRSGEGRMRPPGPKTKIGNRDEVSNSKVGARQPFDPSKGQNKMSYREWSDTHTGGKKKSRWKHATTNERQGRAWQKRAKDKYGKDWNEVSQSDVAKTRAKNRKKARVKPKGYRPRNPEMGRKMPPPKLPGGPDKPVAKPGTQAYQPARLPKPKQPGVGSNGTAGLANGIGRAPNKKPRAGEDYKAFAKRAGGSNAALGARFRKSKGLGMTAAQKAKLMKGAKRRGRK